MIFGQAKFANGGLVLGSSQFSQKNNAHVKVVKFDL